MKIRSIIVDDSPLNMEMLSDLLRDETHSIDVVGRAQNGTDAVALIKREAPDLVFMDIQIYTRHGRAHVAPRLCYRRRCSPSCSHWRMPG